MFPSFLNFIFRICLFVGCNLIKILQNSPRNFKVPSSVKDPDLIKSSGSGADQKLS